MALATTVSIAAIGAFGSEALASQWHFNGNTLYYTGDVTGRDPAVLRQILTAARANGIQVDRVVFRNSPGGAASGGVGMGRVIREFGLDTVLDGGCFSACADAFVGGVNRYYTDYDIPSFGLWDGTVLGIHGTAFGGRPLPYPQQEIYIDYYREMLGPVAFERAKDRIIQAHYELTQQSGFLRYFDPKKAAIPTRFCPTSNQTETGGCTSYPDVTMKSDAMASSDQYVTINDRLVITGEHNGNVANNWDKGVRYDEDTQSLGNHHAFGFDFNDRYSQVFVTPGGRWNLDTTAAAQYVVVDGGELNLGTNGRINLADLIAARNGGIIRMNGASIGSQTLVSDGGVLGGRGTLGATTVIQNGGTLLAEDIVMRPYDLAPIAPQGFYANTRNEDVRIGKGRILTIEEGGALAFRVSNTTTTSPLRLEQARYFLLEEDRLAGDYNLVANHNKAQLNVSQGAALALDIQSGFYAGGHVVPLVSGIIDASAIKRPVAPCAREGGQYVGLWCNTVTERGLTAAAPVSPFVNGKFTTAVRPGDPGYTVDLTKADAVFHPRNNSLLTFNVRQTGEAIWLEANPAFEDVDLFGNSRSGNELGVALRTASYDANTKLGPLLGHLQFADRDIARREAGVVRGDGHSSLRLVGRSFIDSFSDALFSATRDPGHATGLGHAAIASTASDLLNNEGRIGIGGAVIGGTTAQEAVKAERSPYDMSRPTTLWATAFGRTGKLKAYESIDALEYNGYGALMGASRQLSDNTRLGLAVGYGQLNANTRPINSFNGKIEALTAALYGDSEYSRGYVSGQLGYTQLKSDTRRTISDIEGLEGLNQAEYDSDALFARFEHGFDLNTKNNATLTLLAPVVDYINISGTSFKDKGNSPAALAGELDDVESLRAGLGLQVKKEIVQGDWRVTPYARVVWQRDFLEREAISVNNFVLAPELPFDAASRRLGRHALDWNIGLRSSTRSENVNLSVEYQGQTIRGETAHGLQAGIQYRF
ncbi:MULTISPECIES: autotransporter domain-containing protein [unclassified Brevundimonas]|uniref:autotransporter domain-containing protein n=1 Tax=unclassified Brevundimonas TaxID=2622653 RepID=UPI0025C2B74D|nr:MULTISPECIES: autotransporter domain-containing protein [unclassified Brevundimonas]